MARTIKDSSLDSREARKRLTARPKPYYRLIEEGLHLGFRKPRGRRGRPAGAGKWVCRRYIGGQAYVVEAIGIADDFSDANGKSILDFKQAQNKARTFMPGAKSGPFKVKDALEQYFAKIDAEGRSSYDLRRRIAPHLGRLGDVACDKLTAEELRKWLAAVAHAPARLRTRKGQKQKYRDDPKDADAIRQRQATANRMLTVLKAALNLGYHEGKITSPAAWERVKPFGQVDVARVRYLTIAEATRLINACDRTFRPLVQAALETGCRYAELARLEVADFTVGKQSRRDENGNAVKVEVGTIAVWLSKAGKVRHVVVTDDGIRFFRHLSVGRARADLLLPNARGKAWAKSAQQRPMIEACKHAKIKPRVSFHALRHTWASHSVMNGMPLMVVARNLGHSDTRMVEKHYGHLAPSFIADAVRKDAPRFGVTESDNVSAIR